MAVQVGLSTQATYHASLTCATRLSVLSQVLAEVVGAVLVRPVDQHRVAG